MDICGLLGKLACAIQASHALFKIIKSQYKEKLIIVYLSLDEDMDKWIEASKQEQLIPYDYNFIVDNKFTAKLLDELNVSSIPRYLLYNGTSKLIHKNAPSTVKHADQIVVLEKGEIVEIGKHYELVKQQGVYYKLIKDQLELGN